MITSVNIKNSTGSWGDAKLYNSATFDERLDEQLDTGSIQLITNSESVPFNDFCSIKVVITDNNGSPKTMYFCGSDTVEKRGAGYYIHTLELVEPTRLLMGIIIEGRKVTQAISSEKKSLYRVLLGLLNTFETKEKGAQSKFRIAVSDKVGNLLRGTISPEFHWESGTLLWECLLDIGNVINAIPRLEADNNGDFVNLSFDLINEETKEYEFQ
jgi:hypothetical protein